MPAEHLTRLAREAEASAIDAELLARRCERMGNALIARTRRYIWAGRLAAGIILLSFSLTSLGLHCLVAQSYRVWRIRHPHRVRLYRRVSYTAAAFTACCSMGLLYPNGFRAWLRQLEEREHACDALAMRALVARQNYATLYAWAQSMTEKHTNNKTNRKKQRKAFHVFSSATADEAEAAEDEPSVTSTAWSRVCVQLPSASQSTPGSSHTEQDRRKGSESEEEEAAAEQRRMLEAQLMKPQAPGKHKTSAEEDDSTAHDTQNKTKEVEEKVMVYEWRWPDIVAAKERGEELQRALMCCHAAWSALVTDVQRLAKQSGLSSDLL